MNFLTKLLTFRRRTPEISRTREVSTTPNREVVPSSRPITDSFSCPYCFSKKFIRRGFRKKKLERVQLYLCLNCHKTFTPQITKGKHYPLEIIFRAVSLYHLGYSLEEVCGIINQQKTTLSGDSFGTTSTNFGGSSEMRGSRLSSFLTIANQKSFVKPFDKLRLKGCGPEGSCTPETVLEKRVPHYAGPTPQELLSISPSTLSTWLKELEEYCPYRRYRSFALQLAKPKEMVLTATLAHQQLYRYRFHQIKAHLIISEDIKHRRFGPLKEFLEMVPVECPHQYFQKGLRASEAPLTFSKTQMIVRAKKNYATKICSFVLQSVKERKGRHEALQKFMLANDTVTVATEVPVYLTLDDLEHFQTQLGFEIFQKNQKTQKIRESDKPESQNSGNSDIPEPQISDISDPLSFPSFPKLITGHIDFVQIRNGQIHLLDYKPNAEKERPIEQLTLYAMALSRLTGLRLFEFKCAWFDENDYFEFYPLHVLHKPYKGRRKRKVYTMEGIYNINKNEKQISQIRPVITL